IDAVANVAALTPVFGLIGADYLAMFAAAQVLHTPAPCRVPNPAASGTGDGPAADVHWPDPSPLHHWWTEVMDGAPPPRPRRAA
ncbi:hypothetical protein ACLML9_00160, partial [Nocardia sp. NPDC002869]